MSETRTGYEARSVLTAINEAAFQDQVLRLARYNGWMAFHDNATNARRTCPHCGEAIRQPRNVSGWPDIVLAQRNRPLWIVELKSQRGRMTPQQASWIDTLRTATGVRAEVWRPDDFDRICALLRRRSE